MKIIIFIKTHRLLTPKLITRESQYTKTLRIVLIKQFGELDIVLFRQASFRGYVNDAYYLVFEFVHFDTLPFHVDVYEVVEVGFGCNVNNYRIL